MTTQPAAAPDDTPQLEGELAQARRAEMWWRRIGLIHRVIAAIVIVPMAGYIWLTIRPASLPVASTRLLGLVFVLSGIFAFIDGRLQWRRAQIKRHIQQLQLKFIARKLSQTDKAAIQVLAEYFKLKRRQMILSSIFAIWLLSMGIGAWFGEHVAADITEILIVLFVLGFMLLFTVGITMPERLYTTAKRAKPVEKMLDKAEQERRT